MIQVFSGCYCAQTDNYAFSTEFAVLMVRRLLRLDKGHLIRAVDLRQIVEAVHAQMSLASEPSSLAEEQFPVETGMLSDHTPRKRRRVE